jgi:hypothetical protein
LTLFFILSIEDQSIKGVRGVTPLWTVFHLYNFIYFWEEERMAWAMLGNATFWAGRDGGGCLESGGERKDRGWKMANEREMSAGKK